MAEIMRRGRFLPCAQRLLSTAQPQMASVKSWLTTLSKPLYAVYVNPLRQLYLNHIAYLWSKFLLMIFLGYWRHSERSETE